VFPLLGEVAYCPAQDARGDLRVAGAGAKVASHRAAGPPGQQAGALPPYVSELNPVEAVWPNLKRSLANLTKQNIDQLTALVKTRLRRMQYRPGLLNGFLAKARLGLSDPHN
jgi:putative transposase